MKQYIVKVINKDGSISYERSRYLRLITLEPNKFGFKDQSGNIVEPTDLELELFNEEQTGSDHVSNGWLTFIGILTLINLIFQLII